MRPAPVHALLFPVPTMRATTSLTALAAVLLLLGCGAPAPGSEATGTVAEAQKVCGQTSVKGVDVSHYDGQIDWNTVKAAGIDFAFAKATESTGYVDPTFATNWAGMKSAGVVRGAYHFFHADVDPTQQANHVVSTVGALDPGDLGIVCDLETANGQSESTILANAITFLQAVTQATGKKAILYVSPAFLSSYAGLGAYDLWIANWNVSCPDVPSEWSTWRFWQHTDQGTVNGISASAVDLNYFNGTLSDLKGSQPDAGSSGGDDASSGGGPDGGASGGDDGGGGGGPQVDAGGGGGGGGGNGDGGKGLATWPGGDSNGCACTAGSSRGVPWSALVGVALFGAASGVRRLRRRGLRLFERA